MKCFKCGCELSDKDFCTSCGEDVRIYKKIITISNMYYNDGLAKANVRDLSGAIVSLRRSLKFNKHNTKARNLLGLVNYEMGEVVTALSEWVISKNLQSQKNIAGDYIKAIQSNPNRLDTINQTIKKYNQALLYCRQESEDLAIIQLKKVLSLNPNLVRGHQLIALLYMRIEELDKAKKALQRAIKIDTTNTTTLRYLRELNVSLERPSAVAAAKARAKEDKISYKSGNETIIQPTVFKENTGFAAVINVIIGLALGAALTWFLILPARIQSIKSESNKSVIEYSDQIAAKNAAVADLEQKLEEAQKETAKAKKELEDYKGDTGIVETYENLLKAIKAHDENELLAALDAMDKIDPSALEGDSLGVYESLQSAMSGNVASTLYNTGLSAYREEDFDTAIQNLERAVELDESNGNALYTLGRAYQKNGDQQKANECFDKVMEKFPNTEIASNARINRH